LDPDADYRHGSFLFTLSTIVTLPLTWSLLRPSTNLTALAPRIKTDFKPEHYDLVEAQRAKAKRKQRKVKRFIAVVVGWLIMAGNLYLILTTAERATTATWNPYEILGIPESLR
jgi:translocation protein SEC63